MGMVIEDLIKDLTFAQNIIDNYEQRLKADMVAMLTELQLDIEDKCHYQSKDNPKLVIDADVVNTIIQQKINALKVDRSVEDGKID